MTLLYSEALKFLRQKQLYFGIAAALLFGILGFLYHLGKPDVSAWSIPVSGLGNLTQTYFIIFPTAFCAFIFSQERSQRTLKIIRSRPLSIVRLVAAKYLLAVIYSFMLFALVLLFLTALGHAFFPSFDFPARGSALIPADAAPAVVIRAYAFQAVANVYLVSLVTFCTVLSGSSLVGFGGSLFVTILGLFASNIRPIEEYLPNTHLNVWKHLLSLSPDYGAVFLDLAMLAVYSLLLFFISCMVYSRREVRE